MTAQINDAFLYRHEEYAVAGISEGDLLDIYGLGLEPASATTACWRGYQAFFALDGSRLVLAALHVNLFQEGGEYRRREGPVINGIRPFASKEKTSDFNNLYEGLNYPMEYSGGVLIADGFISDLYVHMGFHPAWKYEKVVELIFKKGVLQAEFDRSSRCAEIRESFIRSEMEQASGSRQTREEIAEFVKRAFDRTYSF